MIMMDENKPRPRRRGGRARAQNTGGVLANLHGINVVVEEVSGGVGKKSTMRKNKDGGQRMTTMSDEEAKPTPIRKVSKSVKILETKAASKSCKPSRLEKGNTINIYRSPDAELPYSLSPVETATPTPPCSSVKVKTSRNFDDDFRTILFSPLSSASASVDESVESSRNRLEHVIDECKSSQSDEVETESHRTRSVDDDDEGTTTDSSEESTLDEDSRDVDDMSHQQSYADDDEGEDTSALNQVDESEDEDYSIDEDNSNSDDEFEFEECESEIKERNSKGRKKGAEETRIEGRLRNVKNDGDVSVDTIRHEESQTSSTNQLAECKVNLSNILATEKDVTEEDAYDDGPGGKIEDDFAEKEYLVDPNDENASVNDEPEPPLVWPAIPMESSITKRMATESNQPPPSSLPSTPEIYKIVDQLFNEADKETATVKIIVQKVATHFNFPTVQKSTKAIIKRRLTDLMQGNVYTEVENVNRNEPRFVELGPEHNVHDANKVDQDEEAQIPQTLGITVASHDVGGGNISDIVEQDPPFSCSVPDLSQHTDDQGEIFESSDLNNPTINEAHNGNDDGSLLLGVSVISRKTSEKHPNSVHTPENTFQQDGSLSPAASDVLHGIYHNLTVSTVSIAEPTVNYLPTLNELSIHDEQEGDGNDSVLFQNLSPDVSVKSRSVPSTHRVSDNSANAMSLSDPFKDSSKSWGVVEKGKWSLGSQIGAGSFGRVYTGMNAMNGSELQTPWPHLFFLADY